MKKYIKAILSMGFTAAMLASNVIAAPAVTEVISPIVRYYDYKTFHGSTCQARFGAQSGDFNAQNTGFQNRTTVSRWISCPIMRDHTEKTWGAGFTVYLNNAKNTKCYIYSLDPHGTVVGGQTKTVTADGKQKLSFFINKSAKMGNYVMWCNLKSKGYLNSYKLKEHYFNLNVRTDKDAQWPPVFPWPPVIDPVLTK